MRQYRGAWPIHEIMKQFLGSQKSNFVKDTKAESNETKEPDRKKIEAYLNSLPSQKARIQASDDDQGELEEEEEEEGEREEDWEEDDQEEEEVSGEDSQVKKITLQRSNLKTIVSASSKSRYLHDKTSALNDPKPGPASTKIPQKTPHALTEKIHIEKENVKMSLATRGGKVMGGKQSKAHDLCMEKEKPSSLMVQTTAANASKATKGKESKVCICPLLPFNNHNGLFLLETKG